MSRVEQHSFDEGKFQSTFDTYGHGKGNGKSRAAVYKHYKKQEKTPKNTPIQNKATESLSESTKTDQSNESSDFVETEESQERTEQWEDIPWLDGEEVQTPPTIPSPIRRLSTGDGPIGDAHRATQSQLIRWGYMGADRMITHWGRGVMNEPEWSIERHPADYEALEAATNHAMDANGLSIELSPTLVWGVVVAAAYAPPIGHIAKNSDRAIGRSLLRRIGSFLLRPSQWFKRRRQPTPSTVPTFHGTSFSTNEEDFVE
tara:strand:+ start:732 stop:1508 length:777 start_codon:yes stop_codon:yes gene_type:complete